MKNLLLAIILTGTATVVFAQDKCDEVLKKRVSFKVERDKSNDKVTASGAKETNIKLIVTNNTAVSVTAKVEIFSGKQIIQTMVTTSKVAPGASVTIPNKITLLKGKKIDNVGVKVTNTECKDPKKKTAIYLTNNREETKEIIDGIGIY